MALGFLKFAQIFVLKKPFVRKDTKQEPGWFFTFAVKHTVSRLKSLLLEKLHLMFRIWASSILYLV